MARKKDAQGCSFCGHDSKEVGRLITANNVTICDSCNQRCTRLFEKSDSDNLLQADEEEQFELPVPQEIKEYLDSYVIGQEHAKRYLSVAVYNHYKRVYLRNKIDSTSVDLEKSNVLVVGPTGSGKTLLARVLAQKLAVPFVIADATTLTEAGYVGEDVENILLKLIQNADGRITQAERGIIYIDEIDKIGKKGENISLTRDVSGEGVQQALLKIIEGTTASVPPQGGRKHPNQEMLRINTANILIICGGAFVGLESIIESRVSSNPIGFGAVTAHTRGKGDLNWLYSQLLPDDLIKFGLIPEFVGRLPVQTALHELSLNDLVMVLTEPRNALFKQYAVLLELEDTQLCVEDDALEAIARLALLRKTGARGLRNILEKLLLDVMFDLPSIEGEKRVIITQDCVNGETEPVILSGTKIHQSWPNKLRIYESAKSIPDDAEPVERIS